MSTLNFEFSNQIVQWQKSFGRHNLPWQQDITPYRVWLSETMLQQTQVKTVIPYFNTFISNFPNITDLAATPVDNVMHLWAGLGYYSRARNLHKSAQVVSNEYNGTFPNQYEDIIKLPGIGRSTAGAILSLGFKQNYPILDGNVKRIFARVFELDTPYNQTAAINKLWQYAEELMPQKNANIYNQGLMDLGALICTKKNPNCLLCPVNNLCNAYKHNTQDNYPVKALKKTKRNESLSFLVISNEKQIVLKKRPQTGIWGGLWSLPDQHDYPKLNKLAPTKISETFIHQFTHIKLTYDFKYYSLENISLNDSDLIVNISDLDRYAFPKPIKAFIESKLI